MPTNTTSNALKRPTPSLDLDGLQPNNKKARSQIEVPPNIAKELIDWALLGTLDIKSAANLAAVSTGFRDYAQTLHLNEIKTSFLSIVDGKENGEGFLQAENPTLKELAQSYRQSIIALRDLPARQLVERANSKADNLSGFAKYALRLKANPLVASLIRCGGTNSFSQAEIETLTDLLSNFQDLTTLDASSMMVHIQLLTIATFHELELSDKPSHWLLVSAKGIARRIDALPSDDANTEEVYNALENLINRRIDQGPADIIDLMDHVGDASEPLPDEVNNCLDIFHSDFPELVFVTLEVLKRLERKPMRIEDMIISLTNNHVPEEGDYVYNYIQVLKTLDTINNTSRKKQAAQTFLDELVNSWEGEANFIQHASPIEHEARIEAIRIISD